MWDIKLKLIDTHNNRVVTRGKSGEWGKGSQIYGDGWWFDFDVGHTM